MKPGASTQPAPRPPLEGIRVIDASRVLAGPFCGSILADLGADVVRMEHPTIRDEVRNWAPTVAGVSAAHIAVNHTKRSVALDLAAPAGVAVFRRWIAQADVLIENYRPGTLERYGVGSETLRALNPRLVHCSIRAYAAGTAAENLPGYEAAVQASTGVMSVTGENDGDPLRCGVSVLDIGTAMSGVIAVLAALRSRDQTGRGAHVEPALMRTAASFLNYQIAGYGLAGVQPKRFGSGHEALVPYRNFNCADGPLFIAAGNDRLWSRFCEAMQLADASGKLPWPTLADRIAAREAVNDRVARTVAPLRRTDVQARLQAAGIPSSPVNTVAEFVDDPTLVPAGVIAPLAIPDVKTVDLAGPLFGADGLFATRRPPPAVGEHTEQVFGEIGVTAAELAALKQAPRTK